MEISIIKIEIICRDIFLISITLFLFLFPFDQLSSQNLITNGSMNGIPGEAVLASGWSKSQSNLYANTPDLNDNSGILHTTSGYFWAGGIPISSPDGGTWQNVYTGEAFEQTITGLIVGKTYFFRYYYTSQGIREYSLYNSCYPPNIIIKGAVGYNNPTNAGFLFGWNSYCGQLTATSTSITIEATTASENAYYLAYDGFYLSENQFQDPPNTNPPSIAITASSTDICKGTDVTYNSIVSNFGTNPVYQWKKNGKDVGTNATTYIDNLITDNDVVSCVFTCDYGCSTPVTAISNSVSINVIPSFSPSLSINTNTPVICAGSPVKFTSQIANGGTNPIYKWKKNGTEAGSNTNTLTAVDLSDGDLISCDVTFDNKCVNPASVTSNVIAIKVLANPIVMLDHTSWMCAGTRQLDAGDFAAYLWNDGSSNRTLSVNNLGTYYVTVAGNNGCKGSDTTMIKTLLPLPSHFLPTDTSICSYDTLLLIAKPGYKEYLWNNNSTGSTLSIEHAGTYSLEVTDKNNCKGTAFVVVTQKECMKGFFMPNAFSPNNDGINDFYKPLLFGKVKKYHLIIYNRWGEIMFESNDFVKGWDGTFKNQKQDGNVFTWLCTYQFEGEKQEIKKGVVTLIR
jgi:gliding motility-associated-like protein